MRFKLKKNKIISVIIFGVLVFSLVFPVAFKIAGAQEDESSYGAYDGSGTGDESGYSDYSSDGGSVSGSGSGSADSSSGGWGSAVVSGVFGNLGGGAVSSYQQIKKGLEIFGIKMPSAGDVITGVYSAVVEWIIFYIFYFLSMAAAVVFSFGGWLIEIFLKFNMDVINLPTVMLGWEIMLNIANLGFVLAIIIIAFATIFRMETYAMKQTLWKLVVAALLVNFSLIIAGGLIETSHIFSNFFIDKATPTFGSQQNGIKSFAATLTNSLAPQKLLQIKDAKEAGAGFKDLMKKAAGDPAIIIISMAFIFVFTLLGALVFLAIAVMLLIRFVALGILLILAPIVWLFWIFPSTKHLWNQWWEKFIRWTFFAPITLFFLYLVIKTNEQKEKYFSDVLGAGNSPPAGDVARILNDYLLMRNPAQVLGEMVIMLGLMVGGLIVANKMSITFSSTAINWASGAGKWTGTAVGRKGLQWGTAPLRAKLWKDEEGKKTKSFGEKAVEWSNKNWLTRHTLGYAAKGMTRLETAGGEGILKQHMGTVGKMSDSDLKASILTASGPRRIAVIKELQKRKSFGDIDAKNLITDENKSLFGRFGQDVSWSDAERGVKMNTKIAEMLRNLDKNPSVGTTAFLQNLNSEIHNFVKTYKGKDIEVSAIKDLYSGRAKLGLSKETIDDFSKMFADALAAENYQMTPKIVPTMNAKERATFSAVYEEMVNRPGRQKAKEAWEKTMNNYGMGFSAETPITGISQLSPKP